MLHSDERHIVECILAGEPARFRALVQRYQRPLFVYLARMGLSNGEAEDLAQETFVRAWQHLADFDPDRGRFATWLFTIAQRLALTLLARAERTAARSAPQLALAPVVDPDQEQRRSRVVRLSRAPRRRARTRPALLDASRSRLAGSASASGSAPRSGSPSP